MLTVFVNGNKNILELVTLLLDQSRNTKGVVSITVWDYILTVTVGKLVEIFNENGHLNIFEQN